MRLKREISSFDSTEELILEDQFGTEEEMKLEVDNESYNASNESFSGSDMDLKTMENNYHLQGSKINLVRWPRVQYKNKTRN